MTEFLEYIESLQSDSLENITEHSKRSALEMLLKKFAEKSVNFGRIKVLHEPKRKENYGAPDFLVNVDYATVGYVENKKLTENLEKTLKTPQIFKYRELCKNIILTNYLDFYWIFGENIEKVSLCEISDLESKHFIPDKEKCERIENMLLTFFAQVPQYIDNTTDMAVALANRCKNLRVFLTNELFHQTTELQEGRLHDLYSVFQKHIFNELTIKQFGDSFAQTLVYGLFLAKLNAKENILSLKNAKNFISATFQLIHELVAFLEELDKPEYREAKWIVDEILSIFNYLNVEKIQESLSFNKFEDPYIYFYEDFLSVYDPELRKAKGVYYTPTQIVNFIIRVLNDILISTFNISEGFAAKDKVTVLDFATGTGTFLMEIFKQILNNETFAPQKNKIISEHLLKNIFGFECLIAPYTVAHLKLSQYLKESGYEFLYGERMQIFLTNTLEPVELQGRIPFLPAITHEVKQAQNIKDKPVLVITGNPPYSYRSQNTGKWISEKIRNYYFVDGKPLKEKNSKGLQDDYVKFIRFAQNKMDNVEQGVVGIITNHSFLDNPTFRGMRQSLMKTFDQIYFIDLHGNARKKEKSPEGKPDKNVFKIMQGVCISIFIKKRDMEKKIFHTDFWGIKKEKLDLCLNNSLQTVDFQEIKPNSPFYFFVPQNQENRKEYDKFWSVKDIFDVCSIGITSARDKFTIHVKREKLIKTIRDFVNISESDARKKYNLGKDTRDWRVLFAQNDLKNNFFRKGEAYVMDVSKIKKIAYRPFDFRYTFYTGKTCGFHCMPRKNVMKHMEKPNIALITVRQMVIASGRWRHVFVSNTYTSAYLVGSTNYVFPLFYYNGSSGNSTSYLFKENDKRDNFTEKFRNFFKNLFGTKVLDKTQISEIEKSIKELKKQQKKIEKLISDSEKNKFPDEIIIGQKQLFEELKTQIDSKNKELEKFSTENSEVNFSPEQIFAYIYAVLNSNLYQKKYLEFLKMDFPKIPFIENIEIFEKLSTLGQSLIDLHLFDVAKISSKFKHLGKFKGEGNFFVTKIEFLDSKLFINESQYFENVSQEIFDFCVGNCKILEKYLQKRKEISIFESFEEVENIVQIIAETIEISSEIDDLVTAFLL